MYDGLHRNVTSTNFVLGLGLMLDALSELSQYSFYMHEKNIDMCRTNITIENLLNFLKNRKRSLVLHINKQYKT